MNNYNEDVFEFDDNSKEESEKNNSFNYDSISGLGDSNYENEDIFNTEIDYDKDLKSFDGGFNSSTTNSEDSEDTIDYDYSDFENIYDDYSDGIVPNLSDNSDTHEQNTVEGADELVNSDENNEDFNIEDNVQSFDSIPSDDDDDDEGTEIAPSNDDVKQEDVVEEDSKPTHDSKSKIKLSTVPIEELEQLTKYKEDVIESTDISSLLDKVNVNFKDASEVFKKNTDLKKKIDLRFDELKKLQSEIENSRKVQLDEVDKYKEEVYNKLTEKKNEIEKRLNLLKETQTNLETEKKEFEQYKKKELENIDKIQKEVQAAYDDRREELSHIEDVLRKQKDALDEERNQLSLDRIQYESDKNELANNLLKFNDLVNSFTNGVEDIKK